MRKLQFKKILLIVDAIELREISLQEAPLALYEEIANEYYAMKLSAVEELFDFLVSTKLICDTGNSCRYYLCEKQSKFTLGGLCHCRSFS